ncbi:MAG: hypothetical protein DI533_18990 [Cereibacter sphaeroides]|uniref:Secreted protein n=1 Tax=Cereibacter sphaeroides TaxID=1063 RepID=A0A2W5UBQ4_CERSP|nr:MAG: hypothetical protein DI533_18990 [Cereibacter sphaeroides]
MSILRSRLASAVTAGAVTLAAITSGTGPALAKDSDKDVLRAIAGIAAIAAIAGVINQNNVRNQNAQPLTGYSPPPQQPLALQNYVTQPGFYPAEPKPRHNRRGPRLPDTCAMEVGNGRYPTVYYAEECLQRAGVGYGLPQYCAEQVRGGGYWGRVFEGECLRDAGYRSERWR